MKQGDLMMKKVYTTPTMTVHGSVEKITQALGRAATNDFIFLNGDSINDDPDIGFTDGSRDLNINIDFHS